MAIYNRPNHYHIIVAQTVSLEAQQQLMGLFWSLALAVILLFLFVGVMMALVRTMRRRTRLNEQAQTKRQAMANADPWDESGKRLHQTGLLEPWEDQDSETDQDKDPNKGQSWDHGDDKPESGR